MHQKDKVKTWWGDKEVNALELSILHDMFDCTTQEGVDVAFMYAKFMSKKTLTPDNYPIFLRLFETCNHWVIDALLGGNEPLTFFKVVQPNSYIISRCFDLLTKMSPGEIYSKLFLIILGILKTCYENSCEGFRIYPMTPEEVNSIGKHLNDKEDQNDPVNRSILHLLDRLANTSECLPPEDKKREKVATQANNIRGKFLDKTKNIKEAIPENLLKRGDYKKTEIAPSSVKNK